MDYAEQLESVAYVICGENSKITFKNFGEIWQARGVSNHNCLNNILHIKFMLQGKQAFEIYFFFSKNNYVYNYSTTTVVN